MKHSIYDIYHYVINKFRVTNVNTKKHIYSDIISTLKNGVNDYEIIEYIDSLNNVRSWRDVILSSLRNNDKHKMNRIDGTTMYFHNELRITPGPPSVHFDINTGEIISKSEKFFLEMRSSYSVNDMFNYLKSKSQFKYCICDANRTKGALVFLLNKHSVDYTLFLIDTTNNILMNDNKFIYNLLEVDKNINIANENYTRKKTENINNGLSNIILKERDI